MQQEECHQSLYQYNIVKDDDQKMFVAHQQLGEQWEFAAIGRTLLLLMSLIDQYYHAQKRSAHVFQLSIDQVKEVERTKPELVIQHVIKCEKLK